MTEYESLAGREAARFLVTTSFHDPGLGRFRAGDERDLVVDGVVGHFERAGFLRRLETYPDPEAEAPPAEDRPARARKASQ